MLPFSCLVNHILKDGVISGGWGQVQAGLVAFQELLHLNDNDHVIIQYIRELLEECDHYWNLFIFGLYKNTNEGYGINVHL